MRMYINTAQLNIAEIIRLDFKDISNNVTESEVKISMNYETLKLLVNMLAQAVDKQEEVLNAAKKAN